MSGAEKTDERRAEVMELKAETGNFLARIRSAYNQFTRAEKKVADYIVEHPREILFLSITELSDICGVGETSVFRFCRAVGLGGYQEFKMKLGLSMKEEEGEKGALGGAVTLEDDLSTLVQKVLQAEQQVLSETASLLDVAELDRAVSYCSRARRILFFGVGASLSAAMKSAHKFLRIEPKASCVNDAHTQAMLAATMTEEDVAMVFSYSGSTKDTNAVAELAHKNGAKVILITRFHKSPLSEFADVTLLCGARETPLQGGSSGADISQTFLMDLLYTEYYRRNFSRCSQNNEKTAMAVLNKLY